MPKFHRSSAPPTGALMKLRNTRLYGDRDEQIAGNAERARGCPDPDRAIVRTRRKRPAPPTTNAAREAAYSPRAQARRVEKAYAAMVEAQNAVRLARESGDPEARAQFAQVARERRMAWLAVSGTVLEGRAIEVDQGSVVNPMIAV